MFIYGKNTIKDLFNKNPKLIKQIFIDKKRHQFFYSELEKTEIPLRDFAIFNRKTHFEENDNLQGLVAQIEEPSFLNLNEVVKKYSSKNNSLFLILDQIQDPRNFGAIIRNAAAFEVDAILFPTNSSAPLSSIAMKSSSGTWTDIDLVPTNSLNHTIEFLKKNDYWIAAASLQGETNVLENLKDLNKTQSLVIILGNEGSGIRRSLLEKSDFHFKIKMNPKVESLNVSASAAIILNYIYNK